jgi:hypothetical protein
MTGRPSSFTREIADEICERLAEGESLRSICRSDGMPVQATVFRWLSIDEAFLKQYARAREAQADRLADEILDIADDSSHDTESTEHGDRPNNEWIARSRLRVDARKWLASKMAPKKYGDKVTQEITGGGGGALVVKIVRHGDENA